MRVLITILICFIINKSFSQSYPFLHYSTADGLLSNTVYDIIQDQDNNLLIATSTGISKFNGVVFNNNFNENLIENQIYFFRKDSTNRFWLVSNDSKLQYLYKDSIVSELKNKNLNVSFNAGLITNIQLFKNQILFSFKNPRFFCVFKNNKLIEYDLIKTRGYNFKNILVDIIDIKIEKEYFRLLVGNSFIYLDSNLSFIKEVKINKLIQNLNVHIVGREKEYYGVHANRDIYNSNGEFIFKLPTSVYPNDVNRIVELRDIKFICTNNGVFINDSIHILQGINVSSVYQDNNKDYWISTIGNGIYKFSKHFLKQSFTLIPNINITINSLYLGEHLVIYSPNGKLYILSDSKLKLHANFNDTKSSSVEVKSALLPLDKNSLLLLSGSYVSFIKNIHSDKNSIVTLREKQVNINAAMLFNGKILIKGRHYIYKYDSANFFRELTHNKHLEWQSVIYSDYNNFDILLGWHLSKNGNIYFSDRKATFKIDSFFNVKFISKFAFQSFFSNDSILLGIDIKNNLRLIDLSFKKQAKIIKEIKSEFEKFYILNDSIFIVGNS